MSIKENIIKLRKLYGITQDELAKIAGVSRGAVSQWEGGFSEPRMGSIQKIADHFEIMKSNIIEDGGMDDIDPVTKKPLISLIPYKPTSAMVQLVSLGSVHAGELTQEAASEREIEVPANVAGAHPNAIALEVDGDCMNRVIPDGAHILVDPDLDPANGSIVVAETQDYDAVMRRWYKGSSTLMLTADSFSEHDDIVMGADDGPVRVLGVVVWFQAPGEMD